MIAVEAAVAHAVCLQKEGKLQTRNAFGLKAEDLRRDEEMKEKTIEETPGVVTGEEVSQMKEGVQMKGNMKGVGEKMKTDFLVDLIEMEPVGQVTEALVTGTGGSARVSSLTLDGTEVIMTVEIEVGATMDGEESMMRGVTGMADLKAHTTDLEDLYYTDQHHP